MKTNTTDQKSPAEIAASKLRDNLSVLSAESFSASAVVCTHGDKLPFGVIASLNGIILRAIGNVQEIRETLDKPQCQTAPTESAQKDGS